MSEHTTFIHPPANQLSSDDEQKNSSGDDENHNPLENRQALDENDDQRTDLANPVAQNIKPNVLNACENVHQSAPLFHLKSVEERRGAGSDDSLPPKKATEVNGTFINPITLRKVPTLVAPEAENGSSAANGYAMPDDGSGPKSVWRVEHFQLQPIEEHLHGVFYSGDSYVVQYESRGKGAYLYYWIGTHSSTDERATAALKTIELDDQLFGGMATQVRIVQGKEPPHFLAMFDGFGKFNSELFLKSLCSIFDCSLNLLVNNTVVILNGGYPSGFKSVRAGILNGDENQPPTFDINDNHLFHVRSVGNCSHVLTKDMKYGRAFEVDFRARSLNSNDVFVATTKKRFAFVWYGKGSSRVERSIAHDVCRRLAAGGAHAHPQWTVTDPIREGEEEDWFWEALGGSEPYANDKRLQQQSSVEDAVVHAVRLFHCSNASGTFAVEEVHDFDQSNLVSEDVMLLDAYDALWMWTGAHANREERRHAEQFAVEYLKHEAPGRCDSDDKDLCVKIPIYCIKQGSEPLNFCGFFGAWDDKLARRDLQPVWSARKENAQEQVFAFPNGDANSGGGEIRSTLMNTLSVDGLAKSASRSGSPSALLSPPPTRDVITKHESFSALSNKLPQDLPFGVDPRCKEMYLSDEEFLQVFGISYEAYLAVPKWRQLQLKKDLGLF